MKNKKSVIAVVAVCILGIVGTTIAYYTANKTFENVFRTSDYSVSVTEEFESPNDWTPGTTTDKTVIATNTGNVDAAVRVSYVESWEDADGNPLPLVDNQNPQQRYAVINFANAYKWIESEENGTNYYYYKAKLAPGERSASFINSVTYNELANIDVDEECEDDESTCTLTLDGHSGGKYKLTITVETAQYDKYKEIWGTEVEIKDAFNPDFSIISGDLDTVGSVVKIADEEFYVIGQEDATHVKLFSKYNLGVGYGYDTPTYIQDEEAIGMPSSASMPLTQQYKGAVPFSSTAYWEDGSGNLNSSYGSSYPAYIYTNEKSGGEYLASIAEYVEKYVDYLTEQGANVTGRLISEEELNTLNCRFMNCSSGPDYIKNSSYWTGTVADNWGPAILYLYQGGTFSNIDGFGCDNNQAFGVRPVIILEK